MWIVLEYASLGDLLNKIKMHKSKIVYIKVILYFS